MKRRNDVESLPQASKGLMSISSISCLVTGPRKSISILPLFLMLSPAAVKSLPSIQFSLKQKGLHFTP